MAIVADLASNLSAPPAEYGAFPEASAVVVAVLDLVQAGTLMNQSFRTFQEIVREGEAAVVVAVGEVDVDPKASRSKICRSLHSHSDVPGSAPSPM